MTKGEIKAKAIKKDKLVLLFLAIGAIYYYFGDGITRAYHTTSNFISGIAQMININFSNFDEEQTMNIKAVQKASLNMSHPDVNRMVAHLLTESNAKSVKDGDKGNGFGKKSYGPMQVKLGTSLL